MQKILILGLIFTLSGLFNPGVQILAETAVFKKPSVRHLAPTPMPQTGKIKIEVITENAGKISQVSLWYRKKGDTEFHKIAMKANEKRRYEADVFNAEQGLEYYIEVVDANNRYATDGSKNKPYFFESIVLETLPAFHFATGKNEKKQKKVFWKKPWFWVGVVTLIGGAIALSDGGDDKGEPTGTVTVE